MELGSTSSGVQLITAIPSRKLDPRYLGVVANSFKSGDIARVEDNLTGGKHKSAGESGNRRRWAIGIRSESYRVRLPSLPETLLTTLTRSHPIQAQPSR